MVDVLGKHVDHTSAQSLVAHATDALLGHIHMASTSTAAPNTLAQSELSLHLQIARLAQTRHDPGLVEYGIGRSHSSFEVEFQIAHRKGCGDQLQRRFGRQTRAVFGENGQCRAILGLVPVWGCEVEGEQGQVD